MQDQQVIQAILNGQQDMFRLLYRSYATSCWRVALGIVKDELRAEDAVQNAFIKAYQNLHNFKAKSSFKTWLIRIVINESIRLVHANKRYLYLEHDEDIIIDEQDIFKLNDELLNMERKEMERSLHTAVSQLTPAIQLLLRLFYLEDMSIKEIASSMKFSEAKVKTGLHRARKELKSILDKKINFVQE